MSATETTAGTKREIEVEIPTEEVSRETDVLVQKYQKLARIPGFRPGHVPPSIIRQRFSQDIQNDVVDALVPRYFRKETERLGLIPVSQPRVTDLHAIVTVEIRWASRVIRAEPEEPLVRRGRSSRARIVSP